MAAWLGEAGLSGERAAGVAGWGRTSGPRATSSAAERPELLDSTLGNIFITELMTFRPQTRCLCTLLDAFNFFTFY